MPMLAERFVGEGPRHGNTIRMRFSPCTISLTIGCGVVQAEPVGDDALTGPNQIHRRSCGCEVAEEDDGYQPRRCASITTSPTAGRPRRRMRKADSITIHGSSEYAGLLARTTPRWPFSLFSCGGERS